MVGMCVVNVSGRNVSGRNIHAPPLVGRVSPSARAEEREECEW